MTDVADEDGETGIQTPDWAGLEERTEQAGYVEETVARSLVSYFRDCAVATQRGLNVRDVFGESDAQVLVVPGTAWNAAASEGYVAEGKAAVDLAVANQVNPLEKPLVLGALFVVGRHSAGPGRLRSYCAPLLVASVAQTSDSDSATFVLEGDIGLNLNLLADLADVDRNNEEEMMARFEALVDVVPDAPLDPLELDRFCRALDTHINLPFHVGGFTHFVEVDLAGEAAVGGPLRLVAVSALFIGKEAAELSVIRELEAIAQADLSGTALDALLEPDKTAIHKSLDAEATLPDGPPPEPARPEGWHEDIEILELTNSQRRVVARARTEALSVVTGPPGTGKSYSIAAVVLDHLLAGRTVLVTSGTPKAVDVVITKLTDVAGQFVVATAGDRAHQRELAKRIDELTGPTHKPRWYPQAQLEAEREEYYAMRRELGGLEDRLAETLARQGTLAFHLAAVEGLASIAERFDLEKVSRRPEELDRLRLRGLVEPDSGWFRRWRANRAINRLRHELRATEAATDDDLEGAIQLVAHRAELDEVAVALDSNPDLNAGWTRLAEGREALLEKGVRVLAMQRETQLARLLGDTRSRLALRKFAQALRTAQHKAKKELLAEVPVDVLLAAFPCWASTDRHLSHILPLRRALFDLAVVDEASQVDLAAACPSLFRATRALIVGDPHQLRFVCFLSSAAETAAFSRNAIPAALQVTHRFSRNSLFDAADRVVAHRANLILDEHFRSQPHIISFSNVELYGRALRIMTERPHSAGTKAIDVHHVDGRREPAAARNMAEVLRVLELAAGYVRAASGGGPAKTLGLLSPYRDQANALAKGVAERFEPAEIVRHQITCGTAHSLQGDERDIVILSTVIDGDFNPNSLRFLEDPNVFNVAITRAAERVIAVTSVKPDQLPAGEQRYLRKFLLHAERPADPDSLPDTFRSRFEADVAERLRERGYRVISNYPSCGYEIDLVVSNGSNSVAVECDGHPSHFRADGTYTTEDVQRHVVLRRAGWDIYRIPLSSWRTQAVGHLEAIVCRIEQAPIRRTRGRPALPVPQAAPGTVPTPERARQRPVRAAQRATGRAASPRAVSLSKAGCSCGGRWKLRSGRYGQFYGCSRFPRCRRTRAYVP